VEQMKDQRKTKAQLIEELAELRQRVAELEAPETEHERAQEALQESEERYRTLFEQSRDAVNITTRDGQLLDANQAWLDLFGYTRKDIAGLNVEELYADPADRRRFQDEMEENGAVRDYEVKLRKRDSTEMECLVTSTVRRGDDGAVVGYQGIIRDVTERKRAEEALRVERDRAQQYLDLSGVMFVALDEDGTVALINRKGCQVLGCSEEEVVGRDWFDSFLPGRQRDDVRGVFQKLMAGEVEPVEYFENPVLTRNGEERVVAWHNSILADEEGNIIGTLSSGEDITELKRAEGALRESEERHRSLIEDVLGRTQVGVFILDSDFRIVWVNQALEEYFGLRREEVIGLDKKQLIRERIKHVFEDPEHFATAVLATYDNNTYVERFECHVLPHDERQERWLEHRSQPIGSGLYAGGRVELYYDITELKRAQRVLQRLMEFNESIVESMGEGILVNDAQGYITFTNPTTARLLGYEPEELVGQHWTKIVPPDQQPIVEAADERRARGESDRYELELVHKEGTRIPAQVSASPRFADGELVGALAVFTDVTERKKAEDALKRSEATLRSILRAASIGIGLVTNRVIGWTNDAFQEMVGYSGDELVGETARILYESDEEFDRVGRVKYAEVEKEGTGTIETRLKCQDGRVIDILLSSTAIDPADLSAGVVFTALDITERKEGEQALKEYSERLEEMVEERTNELRGAQEELMRKERLAILGQLAGGVSHELRNPLATISNAVYYLQMTLPDADKTTKEYLDLIYQQVRSAAKIVSDLLDFSRETTADREEVAVTQLVAELLERHAPPDDVRATTHVPADLRPVFIDARQIGQVLDNLVTNAYQAMPEGGTLTIRAEAKKDRVHLSVTDAGVGIPKEDMDRLFEPLFSTKPRGIGLGLAVSKIFIEANGGSIEVESEVGRGSTFTLILPTKEAG
jgi:two-component system NtrC family sensor kinase